MLYCFCECLFCACLSSGFSAYVCSRAWMQKDKVEGGGRAREDRVRIRNRLSIERGCGERKTNN